MAAVAVDLANGDLDRARVLHRFGIGHGAILLQT
jgi:hypothetical protein